MKKLLVALVLTLSMTVSAMALTTADFSDFPAQDSWQYDGLSAAVKNGLLNGENGKILPDNSMTRAQMATILVRAFQGQKGADLRGFVDVDANAWYYDYLSKAVQMKIFNGDGNQMRPNDSITRQEAFLVLSRAFALNGKDTTVLNQYTDAASIAPWAKEGMAAMVASGYVKGDGKTLNPLGSITRAEFAVTMDRMVKTYLTKSETVSSVPDGSVMINVPDVTLKNAIVKGNLIIGDGVGEGDVILDNVKVEGNTIVRGGGTNSVIVKGDSSLGYVSVCKVVGDVRLSV